MDKKPIKITEEQLEADRVTVKAKMLELRLNSGLTQKELAKLLDLDYHTIQDIETPDNKKYPQTKTIRSYCLFFDCDMDYLFDRIKTKTHDIDTISSLTGLSDDATDALINPYYETPYNSHTSALSAILEDYYNDSQKNGLIELICKYFEAEQAAYDITLRTESNGTVAYTLLDHDKICIGGDDSLKITPEIVKETYLSQIGKRLDRLAWIYRDIIYEKLVGRRPEDVNYDDIDDPDFRAFVRKHTKVIHFED